MVILRRRERAATGAPLRRDQPEDGDVVATEPPRNLSGAQAILVEQQDGFMQIRIEHAKASLVAKMAGLVSGFGRVKSWPGRGKPELFRLSVSHARHPPHEFFDQFQVLQHAALQRVAGTWASAKTWRYCRNGNSSRPCKICSRQFGELPKQRWNKKAIFPHAQSLAADGQDELLDAVRPELCSCA